MSERFLARFDEDTLELQLSRSLLVWTRLALSGVRGLARLPDDALRALQGAGLVDADREPNGMLVVLAETLERTIVEIDVQLTTLAGTVTGWAAVSPGGAVLATPPGTAPSADPPEPDPELCAITFAPVGNLVYQLVGLLEVGARPPTPPGVRGVPLPAGALDDLLASSGDVASDRAVALAGAMGLDQVHRQALAGIVEHAHARWVATASLAVDDGRSATRRQEVLDAGDAGWWVVVPGEGTEVLLASTGREILRALESLLPSDDELLALSADLAVTGADGGNEARS